MPCQRCKSELIGHVTAKCSDRCGIKVPFINISHDGYVLSNLGIGGGDYIGFKWCLDCGQIQGKWPVAQPGGPT